MRTTWGSAQTWTTGTTATTAIATSTNHLLCQGLIESKDPISRTPLRSPQRANLVFSLRDRENNFIGPGSRTKNNKFTPHIHSPRMLLQRYGFGSKEGLNKSGRVKR